MKITFLDHSSQPGGGQLGLLRYLSGSSDHQRSLIVLQEGMLADRVRAQGIDVEVPQSGHSVAAALPMVSALDQAQFIRRSVLRLRPDVLVANSLRSIALAGIRPVRDCCYVGYLREDLSMGSTGLAKRIALFGGPLERFDGFLANSAWTRSTIPAVLSGKPSAVAFPVSGIADHPVLRSTWNDASPERPLRILSLSRLQEWKGIHILLDAIARLAPQSDPSADDITRRVHVSIAGDALFAPRSYRDELLRLAARCRITVEFLGHVEDVDRLLDSHDVLAHCSLRPEPYGQIIPQAMSHGLLTIATNCGGPAEMITDGETGFLLPAGDPEALASRLRSVLAAPGMIATIGRAAQPAAAPYADSRTVAGLEQAIETVFDGWRQRRDR